MTDKWLRAAARNNAEWCDEMCRAHGIQGTFAESFWSSPRRTPVLYPDAVTLTPAASPDDVLAAIDHASPEPSVKDSFDRLDLRDAGFHVLFEAQWILRPPGPGRSLDELRAITGDPITWGPITTEADLRDWDRNCHTGYDGVLFPAGLLTDPAVTVLAGRIDGDIVCGSVLNTSGEVVGVSNIFASGCDEYAPWEGTVAMASTLFPDRPMVGYERPDDLAASLHQGFTPIGPLRIWLR
ncbi:hypothetical protein [Sphaerisporangium flaviroseum]|uniref:hypothetical protein n=1 Tax=Sphaerisporangium flaviroseum TaxID=509199 RepID=UPI0031EE5AF5